jgi:hypothetical protein
MQQGRARYRDLASVRRLLRVGGRNGLLFLFFTFLLQFRLLLTLTQLSLLLQKKYS